MRKMLCLAGLLGGLALPAQAAPEAAPRLSVAVNEARAVPLSQAAAGVAVGNPLIAAVTVQSDRLIFLTGKGIGATNLVVVDAAGRIILERSVDVTPNQDSSVLLIRGAKAIQHDCAPECIAIEKDQ